MIYSPIGELNGKVVMKERATSQQICRGQRRWRINDRPTDKPTVAPEDELARQLAQVSLYTSKVGTIPRPPRFLNKLVYFFRLVMRRLLVWYTRPLHDYQSH